MIVAFTPPRAYRPLMRLKTLARTLKKGRRALDDATAVLRNGADALESGAHLARAVSERATAATELVATVASGLSALVRPLPRKVDVKVTDVRTNPPRR